jgi:4-aminobutyrate aminotransferase/(S)-3-amino-2-methylpropionate transaminase
MRALELVRDRKTKEPDRDGATAVAKRAVERGLVLLTAGTWGNVLRVLVPLVATDAELDEGLDVLDAALEAGS